MKVLVICNNHNSINILKLCIKLKSFINNLEIVAIFSNHDLANDFYKKIEFKKYISFKIITNQGVKTKNFSSDRNTSTGKRSNNIFQRVKNFIFSFISYFSQIVFLYKLRELIISRRLKKYKAICANYLNNQNFDVLISMSDRTHDYLESPLLCEAKNIGLKIILPYLAQYDLESALSYRLDKFGKIRNEFRPFYPATPYKIVSFFRFKDQLNNGYFFQSPYILNAHRINKTISQYPWWNGNGNSDIVCVDSEHTAQQYMANKVPESKIKIVGHAQLDEVFMSLENRDKIKTTLTNKYNLNDKKNFYILSLPQHAEQGYIDWSDHIDQIEKILKTIEKTNCNFLISIHPRQDKTRYLYLQEKYNCIFVDETLSSIIGISDVFISSNSSTAIWATLCGIPVLNIKGPTKNLFPYLNTVFYVDSINNIDLQLKSIMENDALDFSTDWTKLSRDKIFDGKFLERFINLIS